MDFDHGKELASIDFEHMIGAPLQAVINAQFSAAQTTVDFVQRLGFEEDKQTCRMVSFKFKKDVIRQDGTTVPAAIDLQVPLLTMLPIPYLRVEEVVVDFNAKVNSVQTTTIAQTTNTKIDADLKASGGFGFWKASVGLKTSFSMQSKTSSTNEIKRSYSLQVRVKMVQNELPGGMERLLNILENTIKELPATAPNGGNAGGKVPSGDTAPAGGDDAAADGAAP